MNVAVDERLADAFIDWLGIYGETQTTTPWLFVLNDYTLLIWAVVVCVWTTLASEGWKRLLSQLYCIWGVEDGDADRYVRPEFIGDTRVPVDPASFADGFAVSSAPPPKAPAPSFMPIPHRGSLVKSPPQWGSKLQQKEKEGNA